MISLYRSKYGVVVHDSSTGCIAKFVEKPKEFVGDKINAGKKKKKKKREMMGMRGMGGDERDRRDGRFRRGIVE